MNKKTILSVAIIASATSAFGIVGPRPSRSVAPAPAVHPHHYCLAYHQTADGDGHVGDCDLTAENARLRRVTSPAHDCTDDQVAMTSYNVIIRSCPTFVQL